jgi:hypothetical protein
MSKGGAMMSVHFTGLPWRKSSRSNGNGGNNCVEVAFAGMSIGVRDSKNPDGPVLAFTPAAWDTFVERAKHGEFDDAH